MRCLVKPRTVNGRLLYISLIIYLSSAISLYAVPPKSKPSTAVARTLQTRNFSADMKTALKASINALQDLDYTVDVLNSDVGLITASRTTEEKKAAVSKDGVEPGPSTKIDEEAVEAKRDACITAIGAASVAGIFVVIIGALFGKSDKDDEDEKSSNSSSGKWHKSGRSNSNGGTTINRYYTKDSGPQGPRIYRYKVTVNLEEINQGTTEIRVSASGELEQDGKILESGGIHELEFFKRFFASMNKSLFLDENLPTN